MTINNCQFQVDDDVIAKFKDHEASWMINRLFSTCEKHYREEIFIFSERVTHSTAKITIKTSGGNLISKEIITTPPNAKNRRMYFRYFHPLIEQF